jgi:hypothetical protein
MKRGRKVICGSQEGVLNIFDYSDIEDISDRFPGHPASVDALLALDEDVLLTGSSDGLIRIISILPNKMLGARTRDALCRAHITQPADAYRRRHARCRRGGRALGLAGGAPSVLRGRPGPCKRGALRRAAV